MKLYLSIKGEWAEEFAFWVPKGGLLHVWIKDLPRAVEEGRAVYLTYVDLFGNVERGVGTIETVDLHREEFLIGVDTDFEPGGGPA